MKTAIQTLRGLVRTTVIAVARLVAPYPSLRRGALRILHGMPWLARRVSAILQGPLAAPPRRLHVPMDSGDLSPRVAALYRELQHHRNDRRP